MEKTNIIDVLANREVYALAVAAVVELYLFIYDGCLVTRIKNALA